MPAIIQKNFSLRDRLLFTATLVLFVFLGLMGLVLDRAFQQSAEESLCERLLVQIYGLLSVVEMEADGLMLPELLQEPRFNNPGSGLFALVLDKNGRELWRSPSALDLELRQQDRISLYSDLEPGKERFGRVEQPDNGQKFFLSYKILWQGSAETTTPYTFVVIQNMAAFDVVIASYRSNLWGWLVAVVVVLIIMQGLVMTWGLLPLRRLAEDLKAIEDGKQEYLDGNYPAEITGVTHNLNLLLASERQQREKYRTTLADLAHSLKTPLAILRGAAVQPGEQPQSALKQGNNLRVIDIQKKITDIQQTIDEQVVRMDQIVGYQLERAVIRSSTLVKAPIAVEGTVRKLVVALEKVYLEKGIKIVLDSAVNGCFLGDERDFLEVLGNLIDNACKYGCRQVNVSVNLQPDTALTLIIEDDGQGIEENQRDQILTRGLRLDSQESGQGIGLAIVVEIVERYGGSIAFGESILGGLKVKLALP
ncbi:MAG: GHKL domain-containing protein [Pseudomonadales bacterium]|nr:GHKL domain-containing protein [Pseudomonadales bacterium]